MLPFVTTRRVTSTGHEPVHLARQEFAADRVAHVVGQEREGREVERRRERADDVGLQGERVGDVGLVGQAVPQHVEQEARGGDAGGRRAPRGSRTTTWETRAAPGAARASPSPSAGADTVKIRGRPALGSRPAVPRLRRHRSSSRHPPSTSQPFSVARNAATAKPAAAARPACRCAPRTAIGTISLTTTTIIAPAAIDWISAIASASVSLSTA